MNSEENIKNQDFKVNDQRRFAADGTVLSEAEGRADIPKTEQSGESDLSAKAEEVFAEDFMKASFSSLIFSIASGAQSALGIAPHPLSGKIEKNLGQAQYSIDLLGILLEKTKNNLSHEEERLLQALLYDLRLRFLEARKAESEPSL